MADKTSVVEMTDSFEIVLNPPEAGTDPASPQLAEIGKRPADSASRDAWVAYVVALGGDEHFVTSETAHFDSKTAQVLTAPALDKATLIRLADHLGG